MPDQKVTIALGDTLKNDLAELVRSDRKHYHYLHYADVRVNITETKSAGAENGILKGSGYDYGLELHVRVLAGEKMSAPGYFGISLGLTDLPRFFDIVKESIETSYDRALYKAAHKSARKQIWGELGHSLWSTTLAPVRARVATIPATFRIWPLDVPLSEVGKTAQTVSHQLKTTDPRTKLNYIGVATWAERELFASSQGTLIDQTFCYTQGLVYVVASGTVQQEHYDYLGHQRGWETLEGVNERFIRLAPLAVFAGDLAAEAIELTSCPPCPWSDHPVTVVTDPHYNTLLSHEIIGHPSELDRNLKMETAYAGRSWLYKGPADTMIGKRIGSDTFNAYSDPGLPGYGHYSYDHEGTPAKKVWHVKNGIFQGFMNSRQTSAILGDEPNGHWKASGGQLVPLIRMSNTVFAGGNRDPNDIIAEVDHGYYLVGHRTPSIAESRENFRISARKVYEIKNGKIGTLYRDGGMMADSRAFFMSMDAAGADFRLYPIANCGKGQPMQTKRLGNGGPTIRSKAKITGGAS